MRSLYRHEKEKHTRGLKPSGFLGFFLLNALNRVVSELTPVGFQPDRL
jgi:hypothetical protein